MGVVIAVWVVCGTLAYGITFAYFQREYPEHALLYYRQDMATAWMFAIMGPLGMVLSLALSGFAKHGLKWRSK